MSKTQTLDLKWTISLVQLEILTIFELILLALQSFQIHPTFTTDQCSHHPRSWPRLLWSELISLKVMELGFPSKPCGLIHF